MCIVITDTIRRESLIYSEEAILTNSFRCQHEWNRTVSEAWIPHSIRFPVIQQLQISIISAQSIDRSESNHYYYDAKNRNTKSSVWTASWLAGWPLTCDSRSCRAWMLSSVVCQFNDCTCDFCHLICLSVRCSRYPCAMPSAHTAYTCHTITEKFVHLKCADQNEEKKILCWNLPHLIRCWRRTLYFEILFYLIVW